MFNFIHLQLQEIKGNVLPFDGINIITIGDLYKLKPVKDDYIFENLQVGYWHQICGVIIAKFLSQQK